ncbi:uncharacterized protein LOC122225471 [Panthera leo]|uniref:uncharacterized protein LOC122225471 n=1 Tax=Panthera leo TaxID=9689 RepID=UPI001C6963D5|nr:uncharacterized protein LOC122225471 [Panthera leo]
MSSCNRDNALGRRSEGVAMSGRWKTSRQQCASSFPPTSPLSLALRLRTRREHRGRALAGATRLRPRVSPLQPSGPAGPASPTTAPPHHPELGRKALPRVDETQDHAGSECRGHQGHWGSGCGFCRGPAHGSDQENADKPGCGPAPAEACLGVLGPEGGSPQAISAPPPRFRDPQIHDSVATWPRVPLERALLGHDQALQSGCTCT